MAGFWLRFWSIAAVVAALILAVMFSNYVATLVR